MTVETASLTTPPRPWLASLTYLGFQLNVWLEAGNHDLTFADIYRGLDDESLWDVLKEKIPRLDVGIFTEFPDTGQGPAVVRALRDAAEGMRHRERRKYGVDEGGLSLLLAYVLEAIQQEYWIPGTTSRYRAHTSAQLTSDQYIGRSAGMQNTWAIIFDHGSNTWVIVDASQSNQPLAGTDVYRSSHEAIAAAVAFASQLGYRVTTVTQLNRYDFALILTSGLK